MVQDASRLQNVPVHAKNECRRRALQTYATKRYLFWPGEGRQCALRFSGVFLPPPWRSSGQFHGHTGDSSNILHANTVSGRWLLAKKTSCTSHFPSGAHIQGKRPVRNIPHVEQVPRRCPLHFFTGEMHVHKDNSRAFPHSWPLSCATPFCKTIPTCRFTSSSPRDWCRSLKSVSPLARSSSVKIGATTLPPTS